MKNRSSLPFGELADLPLHEVMPKLRACIENLSLEEVAMLVRPPANAPPASSSLEAAAAVVVGLPTPGCEAEADGACGDSPCAGGDSGNVSAAARLLGVDRKALERKMARYRLRGASGRAGA